MIFFPVVNLSSDSFSSDEESCRPSIGEDVAGECSEFSAMEEIGESGSQRWKSFSLPTSENVAKAAAAAANVVGSPRPSVVLSSSDDGCDSPLKRIQNQMSKVLKGFTQSGDKRSLTYNPEVLTKQKRQWANFQLQSLDNRSYIEPEKLIESMVVVGLHPSFDAQSLGRLLVQRKSKVSEKFRFSLSGPNHSRVEPNFEPQVLFAYPPDRQLPLKYKDLLSFCFPGGVEVHAVQKSSSMSELNEILVAQEHLKQSELSFVFRLQVADSSTLYGCCVLVEELVDKPSQLIALLSEGQPVNSCLGRYIFTTRRCYCILTRIPFFELHFGVLNSIFIEERLERLTKSMTVLDIEMPDAHNKVEALEESGSGLSQNPQSSSSRDDTGDSLTTHMYKKETDTSEKEPTVDLQNSDGSTMSKPSKDKCTQGSVQPLLQHREEECSEPCSSFQGCSEDRHLRSDNDEADTGETSISGRNDFSNHDDILEWAKANNLGSLQIISEYYKLDCPERESTISFHPLEHLHPLEHHRGGERILNISGSVLDLSSCKTSLERAEVLHALIAEEEASALSTWAISCMCGSLSLEHVLTLFAGALLEKQIVFICSNLGILSASVLSMIPLIRPYQWQSLLMPVLPNDMLDFLDAPVPYIVGVQSKNVEVQTRSANAILVDVRKNQVKSSSMPQLPNQKELISSLIPYHSKLVEESFLGKKRPVYECTNEQVEAAKGFLTVLRDYLDRLCSSLRSHTITNVQSNDDKVSLLLKESFIDSFPSCDRPFMKLFLDTQMFSVHTDLVLSFFENE